MMSKKIMHAALRAFAAATSMLCALLAHAADISPPAHLRDTGLYVDGSMSIVRAENRRFTPQYPLWSDGATKRRWVFLPAGTAIDAAQIDAWEFPRGTRLWKEFSHAGRAVETRYIERRADGSWLFASYVWNAEGTDAVLAPAIGIAALPVAQAPGGRYAIPSTEDCRACHEGTAVPVLGFSALQLSPDRDPLAPHAETVGPDSLDLTQLVERGLIRNVPANFIAQPPRIAATSPIERAALGYLHANCGHCHNAIGPLAPLDLTLAQSTQNITAALRSTLGINSEFRPHGVSHAMQRIAAGQPDNSVLLLRMQARDPITQMPPLGTQQVDTQAVALLYRWIQQLSVNANGAVAPAIKKGDLP